MQEHLKKMITERDDIKGKIKKAKKAVEKPPYGITEDCVELIKKQLVPMEQYLAILEERIAKEGGE